MKQLKSAIQTQIIRPVEDLYDMFRTDSPTSNPLKLALGTIFGNMSSDPNGTFLSPEDLATIAGEWKYCTTHRTTDYQNRIVERDIETDIYKNMATGEAIGIFKIIIDESNPNESPISLAFKSIDISHLLLSFDESKEVSFGFITVNGEESWFALNANVLSDYVNIDLQSGDAYHVYEKIETTQDIIDAINEQSDIHVTALRLICYDTLVDFDN